MIDLATLDQLVGDLKAAYAAQEEGIWSFDPDNSFCSSVNMFLMSPKMKHELDMLISQRPHQRLLRKCQHRRIHRRRKRKQ
jgi:hypothetical protein